MLKFKEVKMYILILKPSLFGIHKVVHETSQLYYIEFKEPFWGRQIAVLKRKWYIIKLTIKH